jgi:hypothetical protein
MLANKEIWLAARAMLKRFGAGAEAESETRAAECAEARDADGVALWRSISYAIRQLADVQPRPRQALH